MVTTITARPTETARIGGIASVKGAAAEQEADQHQDRDQRDGHLQSAVQHHADRARGLAAGGELDADEMLDGVAGDGDDDQAREGLADAEPFDSRLQRRDEPLGDEGRREAASRPARRRRSRAARRRCGRAPRPAGCARRGSAWRGWRRRRPSAAPSAQTMDSACSWAPAGRWNSCASVGSTSAATASMSSDAIIRGVPAAEAQHAVPPAAGQERQAEQQQRVARGSSPPAPPGRRL